MLAGVSAGFTTRWSGTSPAPWSTLNLSENVGDAKRHVSQNRKVLLDHLKWPGALIIPRQVHGSEVLIIEEPTDWDALEGDAAITSASGILLGVLVADCVPILLADRRGRAVGCVHAGWRGTAQDIATRAVNAMTAFAGTDPEDVQAAIGPCIGPCCYEVDDPVLQALSRACPGGLPQTTRVDLQEINRRQLVAAGMIDDHIEILRLCTSCRKDLFFSYRRDFGQTGRMMGFIGLR